MGKKDKLKGADKVEKFTSMKKIFLTLVAFCFFVAAGVVIAYNNFALFNVASEFANEAQKAELMSQVWINIIVAVAVFVTCLIILSFALNPLVGKFWKIRDVAIEIARGNLTARVDIKSKSELGIVANEFNRFIEHTASIVKEIDDKSKVLDELITKLREGSGSAFESTISSTDSVNTVIDQINEVNSAIEATAEAYSQNSRDVNIMASSVEEISATINEMSSTTDEINQNAIQVTQVTQGLSKEFDEIRDGNNIITTSMNNINKAMADFADSLELINESCQSSIGVARDAEERSKSAMKSFDETNKAVNNVSKVIDIINSIAEQTNLLALNATIEAASAGEAGKGFAIVATEVKSLANQTRKATEQIEDQVQTMQDQMEHSIATVKQISKIIESLSLSSIEIATSVDAQTGSIEELTTEVKDASELMNVSNEKIENGVVSLHQTNSQMNVIAEGINEIAQSSSQITAATQSSSQNISQLAVTFEEISATSQEMSKNVHEVQTNVDNVGENMKQQMDSKGHIVTSIQDIGEAFNELHSLVGKFIIYKEQLKQDRIIEESLETETIAEQ